MNSRLSLAQKVALVAMVSTSTSCLAQKDQAALPLKQMLNNKTYILISPAESWLYPGGLVVTNGKTSTFIDLPSSLARPTPQEVEGVVFPAEVQKHSFSFSAILTGLEAIIGGNPGVGGGHSKEQTIKQLQAGGSRIPYDSAQRVLLDDKVKANVSKWVTQKGWQVFVVGTVLTTKNISISSTSNTNLDLSFNGSVVSKCTPVALPDPAPPAIKTAETGSDTSTVAPKKVPSSSPSESSATHSSTATKNSPAVASAAGATSPASTSAGKPGGELHLCIGGANSLAMNTDTALDFAVSAYRVTKTSTGLDLEPILGMPPNGQAESADTPSSRDLAISIARSVPSHLRRTSWNRAVRVLATHSPQTSSR